MPKIIKASIILLLSLISQGILLSSFAQLSSKFNDDDSYNTEVKKLVGNKYKKARAFKNEMAAVEQDGKWGFINKKGKEVVQMRYDLVTDFWDKQVTAVKEGSQWMIINKKGEEIKLLDIDFFGGFIDGRARVVKGNNQNFIDVRGEYVGSWTPIPQRKEWPGSTRLYPDGFRRNHVPCPENIDFEMNSFTNWVCQTGHAEYNSTTSANLLFLTNNTSPDQGLINHQTILTSNLSNIDRYGGFPISSQDNSNFLVKLGNDNLLSVGAITGCTNCPDARAEAIEYTVVVPDDAYDFNVMYDFAAVLVEPTNGPHEFNEKPRFKLIVYNPDTHDTISCASADYVADNSVTSANGFLPSTTSPTGAGGIAWYRPWSTVFINLTRYRNQTLKLKFVTEDCTRGGHWGYAYLDVRQCQLAISAVNTCDVPSRTILTGPPGFQNYQWFDQNYNPLGTGITVNLPTALVVGDTVHLEITPSAGIVSGGLCKDTINTIVVNDTILLDAGPDKTICARQQTTIGTSSTNSNYTFSWSPQATVISPNTATTTVNPINTTQYYLTVTNQITRCQRIDSVIVYVRPIPNIQFPDTFICSGQSYQFSVSGADQFTWSPISSLVVNNSTGSNVTVTPTLTTTYAVSGSFNATGCTIDTTYRLLVDPLPQASFTSPSAMCLRQNLFNFQSTSTISTGNITNYAWDFGDASGVINGNAVQHSYAVAQSYTVTHTVTSNKGCKKDISRVVTVNQEPDASANANGPTTFCQGDNVELTGSFTNGSSIVNQTQWLYNQNPIGVINANPIQAHLSGQYQFEVSDGNNCKDTSTPITVTVHPLPTSVPDLTPANATFLCHGSFIQLTAQASNASSFQWYFESLSNLGVLIPIVGATQSTYQTDSQGIYHVELSTNTSPVCKLRQSDTVRFTRYYKPSPSFNNPFVCAGQPVQFHNLSNISQSGPVIWQWNFGDNTPLVSIKNPIHTYTSGDFYNVTLKIIPQNCPQLDSLVVRQIEIFPTEPGIRYPDVHALLNTSTILQARELYNTSSLNWTPTHQLLNNPSSAQQIFRGNQQMDYTIQLISDKGCITYDKQKVLIFKESDIVVPDIFTPNNDSHNDKLDIFLVGMNKLTFFRVFNRWGQLLFETTDPSKQWDGRFQGKLQPTETYVWTAEGISITGKKIYKRGQTILAQ